MDQKRFACRPAGSLTYLAARLLVWVWPSLVTACAAVRAKQLAEEWGPLFGLSASEFLEY